MNFFHIFVVVLLGSACVGLGVREEEEEPITSGPCGANMSWSYDNDTHTITFTGSGAMNSSYSYFWERYPPWHPLKPQIEKAVFDKDITNVGQETLRNCGQLTSIIFPDNITQIPFYFCHGCSSLESVEIPEGVREINDNGFQGCSKLKSITLPDTLTRIGSYSFHGCKSLTTITLPQSLTTIDLRSFEKSGLKSITIPGKVTKIEDWAFGSCSSLTSIIISGSVTLIDAWAFGISDNLKSVGFLGTQDPRNPSGVFSKAPKLVCVPEEYNSTTFCRASVTKNSSLCGALYKQDSCNEAVYDVENNTWVLIEKENGTDECLFMGRSDRIQTATVFAYMLILIFTIVLLP